MRLTKLSETQPTKIKSSDESCTREAWDHSFALFEVALVKSELHPVKKNISRKPRTTKQLWDM